MLHCGMGCIRIYWAVGQSDSHSGGVSIYNKYESLYTYSLSIFGSDVVCGILMPPQIVCGICREMESFFDGQPTLVSIAADGQSSMDVLVKVVQGYGH